MSLDLAFERFTLDNGLTVILHEDHALPLVVVNLWYDVGSKDEVSGRTGFAHLFEHLMFMGTERVPEGRFDEIMESGGGSNNASTSEDRTNYHSTGPSHLLPTLLWLEADRLESLGRAMTQEKLDLQRDVVRNERRQSYENQPYAKAWLLLPGLLHPPGHPYAHPVIGSHEDLEAASVEDVKEFFAAYYAPNNASLVVAGDFDPKAARALVSDLFASIPRGVDPPRRRAPAAAVRGVVERAVPDDVPAPRTSMSWLSPVHFQEGDAEMDLVAAILAEGASSRLERTLVRDLKLAQDVGARQESGELASVFTISATALPGVPLASVEAAIDVELARFAAEGPTPAEVERVVNKEEAEFVRGLQDLGRRADVLNMYQTILGDPGRLAWDLARYRRATPAGLRSFAAKVLDPGARVILRTVPAARAAGGASARDREPAPLEPARWRVPEPVVSALQGGSGPGLWLLERRAVPLVAVELVVGPGAMADAPGREGVTALLADLLREGAGERDAVAFAAAIDRLGSEFKVEAGRHAMAIGMTCLEKHLDETLDLVADALLRPRLGEEDFARRKALRLAEIEQRAADPAQIAAVVSQRRLRESQGRPGHPVAGWKSSVAALEPAHVHEAWRALLDRAATGCFVAAGAVSPDALRAKLEARFGGLRRPAAAAPRPAAGAGAPGGLEFLIVDRPGAPQTVIRFHRDAETLASPRTPALLIANTLFGGSFTSRLNRNLREEHGFTYGVRSRFSLSGTEGSFVVGTSVKTEVTGDALREFFAEFARLEAADLEPDEVAKALATERTDWVRDFETVSDAAGRYAAIAEAGLPPAFLGVLHEALGRVTLDDANDAATAMLPRPGVLVLVGDRAAILPQLAGLDLAPPLLVDAEGR